MLQEMVHQLKIVFVAAAATTPPVDFLGGHRGPTSSVKEEQLVLFQLNKCVRVGERLLNDNLLITKRILFSVNPLFAFTAKLSKLSNA